MTEVELVLVFAEPGDPHHGESHTGMQSAYEYAMRAFETGKDLFHRNVRSILDACWPSMPLDEQLRRVWLTESVLCSARLEGGSVPLSSARACGLRFLKPQLDLFPSAVVVALGSKAQQRLRSLGIYQFISAYAVAPPGCNRREAKESWKQIPIALERRRRAGVQFG
jgi:hypothetical protein